MSNDNILEKQIIELLTTKTSLKEDVILAKVQMLITLGADINTKHKGKSILCHAKESNLNKVSKYLIENGGIEEKISPEEEQKLTI